MDKKDVARVRTRSTEIDHFPNALHILWYGGGANILRFVHPAVFMKKTVAFVVLK